MFLLRQIAISTKRLVPPRKAIPEEPHVEGSSRARQSLFFARPVSVTCDMIYCQKIELRFTAACATKRPFRVVSYYFASNKSGHFVCVLQFQATSTLGVLDPPSLAVGLDF